MTRIETLAIEGGLTMDRAVELRQRFLDAIAKTDTLRLTLANVTEIDSTGVQLLMATKRTAQASGKYLELAEHSSEVLAVFALLDLVAYFGDPIHVPPARPGLRQTMPPAPDRSSCAA